MNKKHNKGFTLVEIIVSIALLAMIALFMLPMSIYAIQFAKWNNIKLTAMNLAYSQVEWLKTVKYDELGLDSIGYSPDGIVKEDLYLNETGTNPKTIEGVEYSLLTTITWEDAESTTGEFVVDATKRIDVIVKAKDPIRGIERSYSVIGSLVAFEGERTPSVFAPLRIRAITGENFKEPAKGVKIYAKRGGSVAEWGRTDDEGKAYFTVLTKNLLYDVSPEEWERSDYMMTRPIGKTGTSPNMEWNYIEQLKVVSDDEVLEHIFYVDYPGYIILPEYSEIAEKTKVNINPIDTNPPEGVVWDLDLTTNLENLKDRMIWRTWEYEYKITRDFKEGGINYTDEYFFVDETNKLWNKKFPYVKDNITNLPLKLGFGLKEGKFIKNQEGHIERIELEFTTKISANPEGFGLDFAIFEVIGDVVQVDPISNYTAEFILSNDARKCDIIFSEFESEISTDKLRLEIRNLSLEELVNEYGMKLPGDYNYCNLVLKE